MSSSAVVDEVCGGGEYSVLWENGHFSLCFVDVVLFGITTLLIVVLGARRLWQMFRLRKVPETVFTKLFGVKLSISLFLFFVEIVQEITFYYRRNVALGTHVLFYSGFTTISWAIALWVLWLEWSRGCKHDFTLPLWWTSMFVVGSVKLQALLDIDNELGWDWSFWYFVGTLILWFIIAVLGLFFDDEVMSVEYRLLSDSMQIAPRGDYGATTATTAPSMRSKPNPEDSANIFSKMTFWWIQGLLAKGRSRPLQQEDIFELSKRDSAREIYAAFEDAWRAERQKKDPSMFRALNKAYGRLFWIGGFFKFVNDTLNFSGPIFLYLIVEFIQEGTQPLYIGIIYSVSLFVSSVIQSMAVNQYFHAVFRVGMHLRSAIVTAVYNKSLRLSGAARASATVGEVVNHMSVDAQRLQDLTMNLHMVWSGPIQILVSIGLLWYYIGYSTGAGLIVLLVIMFPVNGFLIKKMGALQKVMMEAKDVRVKAVNEMLQGIRLIKFFNWESSFYDKIRDVRSVELKWLIYSAYLRAIVFFCWLTTPLLVSLATFAVYVATGHPLLPQTAFTALALFNILRFPINVLPQTISQIVDAKNSVQRIQKYLLSQELDPNAVQATTNNQTPVAVQIRGGEFEWIEGQERPTLSNINITAERGKLIAVVGAVGSGKSSLLSALLGDIRKLKGVVEVNGTLAYVPQQPWIQNATVKENILFGAPFDDRKYDQVVSVCELKPDMLIFPAGENTEIGEKGINLSGGQKQRVSLARAVYQNADIYILDDPLSAVDAHVGKALFNNCINGILRGKTRILVTHQLQYLAAADMIYVLKDGEIQEAGTYDELIKHEGELHRLITTHVKESEEQEEEGDDLDAGNDSGDLMRKSSGSTRSLKASSDKGGEKAKEEKKDPAKLMTVEERDTGEIKAKVYADYIRAGGGWFWFGFWIFVGFTADMTGQMGSNAWLSYWSDAVAETDSTSGSFSFSFSGSVDGDEGYYLGIYGAFGVLSAIATLFKGLVLAWGTMKAAEYYHDKVLRVVMRAPTSFFDTTPVGRILNRFSKDQYTLDETLSRSLMMYLTFLFACVGILIVVAVVTPFFLTAMLPLVWLYSYVQNWYLTASRELKRMDSISRSPIYAQFGETLNGVSTIRAYAAGERFIATNNYKLDLNQAAYFATLAANRWLAVRLEAVGNAVVLFSSFFAVIGRQTVNPGSAGLSLSYALSMTNLLSMLVRMYTEVETQMVSVERMEQYTTIPPEAPEITELRPNSNWPAEGQIKFDNIKLRYREGLDLVLRGITAEIRPREKVGVLGRTGAGKSSLMLALFRMVELAEGKIFIDGIDISKIGLSDLRSRLSIIPQDPTLFGGTIRTNLDPFSRYSDEQVWKALESVSMRAAVEAMLGQLNAPVTEGGDNLSVGQRQLMCLGRALLRRAKILVMDEATAAVDYETDALIQKTIRSEFDYCTVLTIAHRVHTIMDYDRVMVLEKGRLNEFDSPSTLLSNPNSLFASMVNQSGTASKNGAANASSSAIII